MNELIKLLPEQYNKAVLAAKAYASNVNATNKNALDDAHAELFRCLSELQIAAKGLEQPEPAK